jgi:hypothetical protein
MVGFADEKTAERRPDEPGAAGHDDSHSRFILAEYPIQSAEGSIVLNPDASG